MSRIVGLLACHNRKHSTLTCLTSLFDQDLPGHEIEAVVVDDGSADGTARAIGALSQPIEVIRGDGSLYWASSMALAEARAIERDPDYLLWLNDDVVLEPTALATLLATAEGENDARIVVGSLVDSVSGLPTYGGVERVDWHPMRYRLVAPTDGRPLGCTTFNGNVVLVPRIVYRAVGGIDGRFAHAYADYDYGLRARAAGFESVVTGEPIGSCPRGPGSPWADPSLSLAAKYRLMLGRKGVPMRSSARYLRRHGGRLWPVYFSATYVKLAGVHARARLLPVRVQRD
jgi:GT2 family glycosyltransferase